jgi:hypothetical protein
MNVFDKSLLFEMSYALMRRFAFIDVGSPSEAVFSALIDDWAEGDDDAAAVAKSLLVVRATKDIGPAVFRDIARYARERRLDRSVDPGELAFEAFFSYLLPQFEGIDDEAGDGLFRAVAPLVRSERTQRLRTVLRDVLGVELSSAPVKSVPPAPADMEEPAEQDL